MKEDPTVGVFSPEESRRTPHRLGFRGETYINAIRKLGVSWAGVRGKWVAKGNRSKNSLKRSWV